jgi:hypothetical protein
MRTRPISMRNEALARVGYLDCLNLSRLLVHTNAASSAHTMVPDFPTKTMQEIPPITKSSIYGSIATGSSVGID